MQWNSDGRVFPALLGKLHLRVNYRNHRKIGGHRMEELGLSEDSI